MSRVLTLPELAAAARDWRAEGAVIVLAAGVFDPLHMGHVQYLQRARATGNVLIVSVAADHRVNKGPGRPLYAAEYRAGVVAALKVVDAVTVCGAASVAPVIRAVRPHVYVKGEEYKGNPTTALRAEAVAVRATGGRVEYASGPVVLSSSHLFPAGV